MLKIRYILYLSLLSFVLSAEGTRETAPNKNITIDGNPTTDIAALHIDSPEFNNFASYSDVNVNSRLHIHISDPSSESIFLGFSRGAINSTFNLDLDRNFEFRIKDPNGNIVYTNFIASSDTQEGLIANWDQAFNGPMELGNSGGYDAIQVSSADLMSQGFNTKGDYYIEFESESGTQFLIPYWDISVAETTSGTAPIEKKGRIWSYNWAFFAVNDFGFPERPFNGAFYVCAPDVINPDEAFITKIDFNGSEFRPAAFNIAFNSFGITNTGNIIEDRKSFENGNRAVPEYAIFLNDPIDICKTSSPGDLSFNGITRCSKEDFCISFSSTKEGQLDVLLDFDGGDDVYTPDTRDVILSVEILPQQVNQPTCINWNGIDGLGNPINESATTEIPISLSFAQGIYHFPIYDAELLINGFSIETVRPPGPTPKLYYDDTEISAPSGTGEPNLELDGCDLPCHRWSNYQSGGFIGFGNLNTINSWWFSQQTTRQEVFLLPAFYECDVLGPDVICENEIGELSAELFLSPNDATAPDLISTNWSGPSFVGSTNELVAEINQSGDYTFEATWSAPSGDTCTITCSKQIEFTEVAEGRIDTLIEFGESVEINSEIYNQEGTYTQTFETGTGCDSLLIIVVDVFFDVDLTCEIVGPDNICIGDEAVLNVALTKIPDTAPDPFIDLIRWDGPSIVSPAFGEEITINGEGTYSVDVVYENEVGERKRTTCTKVVGLLQPSFSQIDTSGFLGDVIEINGEDYDRTGQYEQISTATNGCDSIITIVVNLLEPDYVCEISGPSQICENSDAELNLSYFPSPPNAPIPDYDIIEWDGPGLSSATGETITISEGGTYEATLQWTNAIGESRITRCSYDIEVVADAEETINAFIFEGDSIRINNETYSEEGQFIQDLIARNGCDSILTINVRVEKSVIYYDFNDCKSSDYSRFTGKTLSELSCAHFSATNVYRENPSTNAHSCTPGVSGVAMCIDALDECEYDAGNEKSIIFEIYVDPVAGQETSLSGLSFYQKAPPTFEWVVGESGLNNFPTLYGLRVLKNGVEIFREDNLSTSFLWTKESFVFANNPEFTITETSAFRFELLPYCLIGNGASVAAWDIDELNIVAGCADDMSRADLVGSIKTYQGKPIPEALVSVQIANDSYNSFEAVTNADGQYAFDNMPRDLNYVMSAEKDNDHLNGVSTLDLVLMQKHILGIETFDNPYDYIAADINNSKDITAIDLIELRKLILGIYDRFPDNKSWKIGASGQRLSIYDPFAFKDESLFYGIGEASNMIGVKIGDINKDNSLEKRAQKDIGMRSIESSDISGAKKFEFYFDQNIDAIGLQLKMFVPGFSQLNSESLVLTQQDYHYDLDQEIMTISYADINQRIQDYTSPLFSIVTKGEQPVLYNSEFLNNEVYVGDNNEIYNITLYQEEESIPGLNEMRIQPNPFTEQSYIHFTTAEEQSVTLELTDETGRLLVRQTKNYSPGKQTIEINRSDLGKTSGIIYCRLSTKDTSQIGKLLIVK